MLLDVMFTEPAHYESSPHTGPSEMERRLLTEEPQKYSILEPGAGWRRPTVCRHRPYNLILVDASWN
jgi:hypothetical protein